MIYPEDFEKKTDFLFVREWLLNNCSCSLGKEKVNQLSFLTDYSLLSRLIEQAREMMNILSDSSIAFPETSLYDMRESLSRIRIEGLYLDEQELSLLRKTLQAATQYSQFFLTLDKQRFPLLSSEPLSVDLEQSQPAVFADYIKQIDRLIDQYGRMRDNASAELARIRRDLQAAQGAVSRALTSILRQAQAEGLIDKDVTPTLREGRLVLPVPPAYKRKIGGIVHDESATGKTVFIEPQQAVEANNRIRELENDEKRERTRILLDFTAQIRPFLPDIQLSQLFLAEVDFLVSKARTALQMKAIAPQLQQKQQFAWQQARHPLLEHRLQKQNKPIVPLSISLGQENRILIISGPNAGGKSVCLKTVALLQYMLQCGLPIPLREDSVVCIFDKIFIDIGDEQSIEDDLSTYSSHLKNMRNFIRYADSRTLLLIDEFGGGTEPQIGGAIAQAVLSQLNHQMAMGVITTHYDNLKHFAEDTEGLQNGAMLYDRGRMMPLFSLSQGQPGSSFAVEIAKQIGLPAEIIEQAKQLVGDNRIDYDRHLQDIARDKRYWEQKRQHIREREKQLEERIAYYEEQIGTVKQKRREILTQAQEEAKTLLQQSNATIERTIREIKEAAADKEKTKAIRQELEQFKDKVEKTVGKEKNKPKQKKHKQHDSSEQKNVAQPTLTLEVGAAVRKKGQDIIGEVLQLTDKQALVAFGNIQSYIPIKNLEVVSHNFAKKQNRQTRVTIPANISQSVHSRKMQFRNELDLRGFRADEALTELMNYIDDAIMVGAGEVRILHGTGTGALRQVTRDYLSNLSKIQSFHDAHPDQGGAGITIVEL